MRWLLHFGCFSAAVAAGPGGPGLCPDDSDQHAGYLEAGPGVEYFYYYATSRSPVPEADPLILWMTGGPGCSSILAMLLENGPCSVEGGSAASGWRLRKNPWSWTEAANVVWVDQPVGVGFSSPGHSDQLVLDESGVARRMVTFLRHFYAKFPHLLHVPFFIIGESYGGHYVPAVAAHVVREQSGIGTLQGIAMGNAEVDLALQWRTKPEMAFTGGVAGSMQGGVIDRATFLRMEEGLPACETCVELCREDRTAMPCMMAMAKCAMSEIMPVKATGLNPYDLRKRCGTTLNASDPSSGLCYVVKNETAFLNDPATKKVLGVPQDRTWAPCNMTAMLPFIVSGDEVVDYRGDVRDLLQAGVRVLVYAGDADFMVDWLGCRAWVERLPWPHREDWLAAPQVPYLIRDEVKGQIQAAHGLTFVQIYSAGHMVPMDQPELALDMVKKFIMQPSPLQASVLGEVVLPLLLLGGLAALAGLIMLGVFARASLVGRRLEEGYIRLDRR